MNTLLLQPSDVLFFRDGRPMSGALTGNGAAWPLPHTLNAALHAALWRSSLGQKPWRHVAKKRRTKENTKRTPFGGLQSVGPFPVRGTGENAQWFFPRPADAQSKGSVSITALPTHLSTGDNSSLPRPLLCGVGSRTPPSKEAHEPWLSLSAFHHYLNDEAPAPASDDFLNDDSIHSREHRIGIGIDPVTGSQNKTDFYTAHYLRLQQDWRLGLLTECREPTCVGAADLTRHLFERDQHITVGGQQRSCTAEFQPHDWESPMPLPMGLNTGFTEHTPGEHLVKWVLLTPSIWPAIDGDNGKRDRFDQPIHKHPGGWLPNWVHPTEGSVLLTSGPGKAKAERLKLEAGKPIAARLVAAIVPKPVVVTGYGLAHETLEQHSGPKSTHLAVPPGAVYYFSAKSRADAEALAAALNWHGSSPGNEVRNHRSTLCGEKGFGIGLCGTWHYDDTWPAHVTAH